MKRIYLLVLCIISISLLTISVNADTVELKNVSSSQATAPPSSISWTYNSSTKTLVITATNTCSIYNLRWILDKVGEVHNLSVNSVSDGDKISSVPGDLDIGGVNTLSFSNITVGGSVILRGFNGISCHTATIGRNLEFYGITGSTSYCTITSATIGGNLIGHECEGTTIVVYSTTVNGNVDVSGFTSCNLGNGNGTVTVNGTVTANCSGTVSFSGVSYYKLSQFNSDVNIAGASYVESNYSTFNKNVTITSDRRILMNNCNLKGTSNLTTTRAFQSSGTGTEDIRLYCSTYGFSYGGAITLRTNNDVVIGNYTPYSSATDDSVSQQENFGYFNLSGTVNIEKASKINIGVASGSGTVNVSKTTIKYLCANSNVKLNMSDCKSINVGIIKTQGTLNADQCDLGQVVCGGGTLTMNITALRLLDK